MWDLAKNGSYLIEYQICINIVPKSAPEAMGSVLEKDPVEGIAFICRCHGCDYCTVERSV